MKNTKGIKNMKPYAFIDSQNLNLGVRSQGWKLDFSVFRRYLKDKYNVEKAFLFIGMVQGNSSLYKYLQECGYVLIFKPTLEIKSREGIKTKGNVDAELVLHAMIEFPNYNKAIIVSGDGDFHCLIEFLLENNKLRAFMAPNHKKYSGLLKRKDFISYTRFVADIRNKVQKKKGPNENKTSSG